ncbi:baseplate J/gp47 family protein [uncultured Acetatifactor sp.]|uniref:baseplate J/gp47 family protein n=1 Tax=uncultured Acetatifactor sp. TaxID=1671927 RepID=UPI0026092F8A|nr:baseplate J/gp47 family protein [uncultured Acetatifactor sp.]
MFDQYTEDYLMNQAREMGDALEVDTREGSLYMDAASGHCLRTAKFYEDLRSVFDFLFADSCTGDVLDEWAAQKQVYRKEATPSYYVPIFDGVAPADLVGDRFMAGGYYFVVVQDGEDFYLRSEVVGTKTNYLLKGERLIPVRNTMGLKSAVLGDMYSAGTDQERDEDLRRRWEEALTEPAENWNEQQYKNCCESYDGVGRAIIAPLAYGPCTVKALIISSEGTVPPESLIKKIQEEMDPGSEGLGRGKVLLGSRFFAVAAGQEAVNISFDVVIASGYSLESTKETVRQELIRYMKGIALDTLDEENMVAQYMKVIGILANVAGIKDLANLTLNGLAENVIIEADNVPVLGELTMNEAAVLKR